MRSNVEALRWPLGVPKLDTPPNRALQAVLNELRRQRGAYMFLRVARRCAPRQHVSCQPSSQLCTAPKALRFPATVPELLEPTRGSVCPFSICRKP